MTDPNRPADESTLMDACAIPDFDIIEERWHATIEERENLERDAQLAFRKDQIGAPRSVVGSAEGPMLFPGFGFNEGGQLTDEGVLLSAVARAACTGQGLADVRSQTRESLAAD